MCQRVKAFWIKPVDLRLQRPSMYVAGSQFTQTYNYGVAGRFGVEKPAQADWDGIGEVSSSSSLEVSDVDGELGVNIQVPKLAPVPDLQRSRPELRGGA